MTRAVAPCTVGRQALDAIGIDPAVVPEVAGRPIAVPGSRVVMSFPDVLGRIVAPDPDHLLVAVVDRMVGGTVEIDGRHDRIDVGTGLGDPGALIAALEDLAKRITTAGGVRAVTGGPYAIPLIAPGAPPDVPSWCSLERPIVAGLADLAVVRPIADPGWRGGRRRAPRLTVR